MFEFPDLKFEKSCDYLENQLQLHNDNKERILDIINNANLDSKKAKNIKSSYYANFVDDANKVLETISNNISSIESLNSRLQTLNVELNTMVAIEPPKTGGKKLYLKNCTDLKDNLIAYSKNFEEMTSKLNLDNVFFADFINKVNYSSTATVNSEDKKIQEELENPLEDIEYSINPDFIERIKNTTLLDFEAFSYNESDSIPVSSPLFILEDLKPKTTEATINPELEIESLLTKLNDLNSGDVLILSLDIPNNESTENESIATTEIIECIEIQEEFAEEIRKIDKIIDNELIPEIRHIEKLTSTPPIKEKRKLKFTKAKRNKSNNLVKDSFMEKVENIKNAVSDNKTLIISERLEEIYLPYKKSELLTYVENNPKTYKSLEDVVKQEFTLPFQFFKNQSSKSRFSETYKLLKDRDDQGFIKAVSYAFKIATKRNLNPVIIAACKSKFELESYVYYLDSNNLNNFRFFDIIYEVNPLKK